MDHRLLQRADSQQEDLQLECLRPVPACYHSRLVWLGLCRPQPLYPPLLGMRPERQDLLRTVLGLVQPVIRMTSHLLVFS